MGDVAKDGRSGPRGWFLGCLSSTAQGVTCGHEGDSTEDQGKEPDGASDARVGLGGVVRQVDGGCTRCRCGRVAEARTGFSGRCVVQGQDCGGVLRGVGRVGDRFDQELTCPLL